MSACELIAIVIFNIVGVKIAYVPYIDEIQNILTLVVGLFILKNINIGCIKNFKKINIITIIFSIVVLISSLRNGGGYISPLSGVTFIIKFLVTIAFFEIVNYKNKAAEVIKVIFKVSTIYIILNDIFIFAFPNLYFTFNNQYFLGNKFEVMYFHLLYIVLYQIYINYFPKVFSFRIRNYKISYKMMNNLIFIVMCILTILISKIVSCSTGLVGCIVVILLFFGKKIWEKLVNKIYFYIGCIAIFDSILLLFEQIINVPLINSFITQVLNRDIEFTGRFAIYAQIGNLIGKNMFLGYGYGNTYFVIKSAMRWFPDAQNGVLQNIMNFGVIGMVLLHFCLYYIIKKSENINAYMLKMLVYTYIVLSSVEITFELNYIWAVAMLLLFVPNKNNNYLVKFSRY